MKLSRLIEPYKENGKTNLGFCNGKAGVYLIYRDGKLRYVGYSGYNLYKTLTRHFQEWDSKKNFKTGITYVRDLKWYHFQVRVCICSPARAEKLEKALIVKYQPKDNVDKLKGHEITPAEQKAYRDFNNAPALTKKELEEEVPF